jgi:hypothetical protein
MLASGVYSINEVRGYYNLNPIEGGEAHFIQINMGEISAVAEASAQQGEPTITDPVEPKGRRGSRLVQVRSIG